MADDLARVLSVAGLALGGVSFAWQVFTWRRGAGHVRVDLRKDTEDVYSGQRDGAEVTVRNVGRGPVFIERISFSVTSDVPVLWKMEDTPGPPLPHSLAAGQATSWAFKLWHGGEFDSPITLSLRAIVGLGDGRLAWSPPIGPVFRVSSAD